MKKVKTGEFDTNLLSKGSILTVQTQGSAIVEMFYNSELIISEPVHQSIKKFGIYEKDLTIKISSVSQDVIYSTINSVIPASSENVLAGINNRQLSDRANADEFINFADFDPSVVSFVSQGNGAAFSIEDNGHYVESTTESTPSSNNFGGIKMSSVNSIGGAWDMSAEYTYPGGSPDNVFYLEIDCQDIGTGNESHEALGLRVYFLTGSATVSTDTSFANGYNIQLGVGTAVKKNGRQIFAFRLSDMFISGIPDLTQVRRIEIRTMNFTKSTEEGTKVRFFGLYTNVKRKGRVLFSFDDGHRAVYTEVFKKHFKPRNWTFSVGLNKGTISLAGRMSISQLLDMQSAGCEMCNHTVNHVALVFVGSSTISGSGPWLITYSFLNHQYLVGDSVPVTGSSQPIVNGLKKIISVTSDTFDVVELVNVDNITGNVFGTCSIPNKNYSDSEIIDNSNWMAENGLIESSMFIYPGGQNNASSWEKMVDMGYKSARATGTNGRPKYNVGNGYGISNPFYLPSINLTNLSTSIGVLALIDAVLLTGGDVHVYGHNFVTSPASSLEFSTLELASLVDGIQTRVNSGLCQIPVIPSSSITNY